MCAFNKIIILFILLTIYITPIFGQEGIIVSNQGNPSNQGSSQEVASHEPLEPTSSIQSTSSNLPTPTQVLVRAIKNWACDSRNRNKVELTTGTEVTTGRGGLSALLDMGNYVGLEDGSTYFPAFRTGKEIALYNKIKDFIATRKSDQKLSQYDLLTMGLDASRDPTTGIANLQVAFLTIHNVVRVLARPGQWYGDIPKNREVSALVVNDMGEGSKIQSQVGHPPTDPMYPIFLDLTGLRTSGGKSLPDILHWKLLLNGMVGNQASISLFNPKTGIFLILPGAMQSGNDLSTETEWNGGCYYYFWIGAIGQLCLGTVGVAAGAIAETSAKLATSAGKQGAVEISSFLEGANFGSMVIENKESFSCANTDKGDFCEKQDEQGRCYCGSVEGLQHIDGSEDYYVDSADRRQGPWNRYSDLNKKELIETGCYRNDMMEGHWINYWPPHHKISEEYYKDGKLIQTIYAEGVLHN